MSRTIRKAAVIGSGVMGSRIAAHLANAGITCQLLDVVPKSLTPEEEARGLTLKHPAVRNRLAAAAIDGLKKASPAALYRNHFSERITPGNIEDHLNQLKDVDWIIEAVVENVEIKKRILALIEKVIRPGIIVSSNTSGISINEMVRERTDEFKRHFLGTHFFNPPRYLKLTELIPGEKTDPEIIRFMSRFMERVLGKGVVIAKDTPNFIGNRIGTYGLLATLQEMREKGFTVDEVDAVTGPLMGRPKSATFRTLDVVGIDTFMYVSNNVLDHVSDESEKSVFSVPDYIRKMVSKNWIGAKSGQGFYKRVKTEKGKEILVLDLDSMEYKQRKKINSPFLATVAKVRGTAEKIRVLVSGEDRYSLLAWNVLKKVLLYSAEKSGEIAESVVEIDQAMKWGFNWEMGPFETWDAIGLESSVLRMEKEGLTVPVWVKEWISAGNHSFYKREKGAAYYCWIPPEKNSEAQFKELKLRKESVSLLTLKDENKTILSNSGASLIDLGDGVACLEFHSPNNAIDDDVIEMTEKSMEEVGRNFRGLVIANEGKHFCVGANILQLLGYAQQKDWSAIDRMIQSFQNTLRRLKYFEKPVVAAPHQMTLGGGVEVCLAADQVIPAAETYAGLVEVGVGLIPAGGGCKEMAARAAVWAEKYRGADLQPAINKAFKTIGGAKVSGSAYEAKDLGLLRDKDRVVINRDHIVYEAKRTVLYLDAAGYTPPREERIKVTGEDGKALLLMAVWNMRRSGYISEYDHFIAAKLAHILSGGDVPANSLVTEQYLLDLEREAFLSLCGEKNTRDRIQYMLKKGKPLRN
ncbi:3-hydroxyacyl-CoA dehydrogenase/enoyl-CoA hydratase family protein [Sporolactobacillus sp. THM7-4]|nr:3-hydroxyacyl-CoA dehydrogenase/enoyl-CoA hydratase family protein [Sporolactobacillus sp. THM7-4]